MRTSTDAADLRDLVARLHVARWTGRLPTDLADGVLDVLGELESATARRADRNAWLRRAASRFSGSAWIKAGILRVEMLAQARQRWPECRDPDVDWRGCVRASLHIDSHIPSRKQLARILDMPE